VKKLARREKEVYNLIVNGLRNSEISKSLGLKSNTISTIKKNIMIKLQVKNLIELYNHSYKINNNNLK